MKKVIKILGRVLIGIVILALIIGAGGAYYFKSYIPNTVAPKSFPQIDGEIKLDGLDAPVDIYRDGMGIPHIYASTQHDLFFAQGILDLDHPGTFSPVAVVFTRRMVSRSSPRPYPW